VVNASQGGGFFVAMPKRHISRNGTASLKNNPHDEIAHCMIVAGMHGAVVRIHTSLALDCSLTFCFTLCPGISRAADRLSVAIEHPAMMLEWKRTGRLDFLQDPQVYRSCPGYLQSLVFSAQTWQANVAIFGSRPQHLKTTAMRWLWAFAIALRDSGHGNHHFVRTGLHFGNTSYGMKSALPFFSKEFTVASSMDAAVWQNVVRDAVTPVARAAVTYCSTIQNALLDAFLAPLDTMVAVIVGPSVSFMAQDANGDLMLVDPVFLNDQQRMPGGLQKSSFVGSIAAPFGTVNSVTVSSPRFFTEQADGSWAPFVLSENLIRFQNYAPYHSLLSKHLFDEGQLRQTTRGHHKRAMALHGDVERGANWYVSGHEHTHAYRLCSRVVCLHASLYLSLYTGTRVTML